MTSNPSGEAGRTAAKWTPGAWKAVEWSCRAATTIVADSKVVVAECSGHGRHTKESLADAKLIAKAKEMAAILQEIVELVRAEAQVDNGEGLKFLNASAQLVTAERILRECGALEENR